MKFWFFFVIFWLGGIPQASAQWDIDDTLCTVPIGVKNAFQKRYPKAEEVFWVKDRGEYRASFFNSGLSQEIRYSSSGKWLCACTYLELTDLPQAAQDFLAQRYPEWEMPSVLLKMEHSNRSTSYRVHYDMPEGMLELIFNNKGNLTQEKMDSYQEED